MRNLGLLFLLPALLLAVVSGCTDYANENYRVVSDTDEILIPFAIEGGNMSRADSGLERESALDKVYLLFYEADNITCSGVPHAIVEAKESETDSRVLSFRMPLILSEDTDYRLIAVANPDEYLPEGYASFPSYVASLGSLHSDTEDKMKFFYKDAITSEAISFLPMTGKSENGRLFSFSRRNGVYEVNASLTFHRKVARIDITNRVNDELTIESVALCNRPSNVGISDSAVSDIRGILSAVDPEHANVEFLTFPEADQQGVQKLSGSIYCFPSVVEEVKEGDTATVCLILKGRYKDDDKSCYYRINVGIAGDRSEVRPNTKYNLIINSVGERGHETPLEAYEASESLLPDVPVSITPMGDCSVKINHETRSIEIDGFAPEIFNGFIDIPFSVNISERYGKDASLKISSVAGSEDGLEWPLEGRISKDSAADFRYCPESFTDGSVYSVTSGSKISKSGQDSHILSLKNGEIFYVSVGSMGPDDPEITRTIRIDASSIPDIDPEYVGLEYTLHIKPRPVIIDDVILRAPDGKVWLVADRNIQDMPSAYPSNRIYAGWTENGKKTQGYHFCKWSEMIIPFKFKNASQSLPLKEDETGREIFCGLSYPFNQTILNYMTGSRTNRYYLSVKEWMGLWEPEGDMSISSPFYTQNDATQWILPDEELMGVMKNRMTQSKMRLFLISDIPAKGNGADLEICCYFPFYGTKPDNHDRTTIGYYIGDTSGLPVSVIQLFPGEAEIISDGPFTSNNYSGFVRLVRPLTEEELADYKENYLGHGSKPLLKAICHPDTYPYAVIP